MRAKGPPSPAADEAGSRLRDRSISIAQAGTLPRLVERIVSVHVVSWRRALPSFGLAEGAKQR